MVDNKQGAKELAKAMCRALVSCATQQIFATRLSGEQILSLSRIAWDAE